MRAPKAIVAAASFVLSACGEVPTRSGPTTAFPGPDWQVSTPESQGIDSARLQEALAYLASKTGSNGTSETLVVRNGYLIWKGADIDRKHSIWSCTKSFTSTAFGLLLEDGKCSMTTLGKEFVAGLAPAYSGVTFRHFATMTSGYDGEGGSYDRWQGRADANALVRPLDPVFPPGTKFHYWDEAMMQFGSALTAVAGESLYTFLKRRITDPIGMKNWTWEPAGTVPNWTGGIHTTARDLARFGLLFLNRGNWNGRQLINASWVEQATSVQVPSSIPFEPISPRQEGPGVYGYNWWVNGVRPDGAREWPGAPVGTFAAQGFNNNKCFVIPEWNMVVVRMGTDGNVDRLVWSGFFEKLSPAIRPAR